MSTKPAGGCQGMGSNRRCPMIRPNPGKPHLRSGFLVSLLQPRPTNGLRRDSRHSVRGGIGSPGTLADRLPAISARLCGTLVALCTMTMQPALYSFTLRHRCDCQRLHARCLVRGPLTPRHERDRDAWIAHSVQVPSAAPPRAWRSRGGACCRFPRASTSPPARVGSRGGSPGLRGHRRVSVGRGFQPRRRCRSSRRASTASPWRPSSPVSLLRWWHKHPPVLSGLLCIEPEKHALCRAAGFVHGLLAQQCCSVGVAAHAADDV